MSKFDDAFHPTPIEDPLQHVRDAVQINGADLRRELERLPADIAHYGFGFARAHRRLLAAKMKADEVRAATYLEARETLMDLGTKITEAVIEGHVLKDIGVVHSRAEVIEAEFEKEQLRAVCDALRAKRENLTSLVLLARAEMASQHGFRDPKTELP